MLTRFYIDEENVLPYAYTGTAGGGNAKNHWQRMIAKRIMNRPWPTGIVAGNVYTLLNPFGNPKNKTVLICPADEKPWALTSSSAEYGDARYNGMEVASSYAPNFTIMSYREKSSKRDAWESVRGSTAAPRWTDKKPVKASLVKRSAKTWMAIDWPSKYAENPLINWQYLNTDKNSSFSFIQNNADKIFGPHNGGTHMDVFDGHAEWLFGWTVNGKKAPSRSISSINDISS
jgi:hypothetical protein